MTTAARDPRATLAPWIAAALPIALVAAGVVASGARWPAVALLAAGFGALWLRRRQAMWIWAAMIPLGVRVAWAGVAAPLLPGMADCGNALSAPVLERLVEATVVVGALAALAVGLRSSRAELSLRLPARRVTTVALLGPLVITPIALAVGPLLAGPFFGPVRIELGIAAAIVPAVLLASANAVMEELVFRGAILGWGARVLGPAGSLVLQAVLFGLLHTGPDFVDPLVALPVLAAVTVGGLIAGLLVRRTGSLLLPIAIHLALDVPLYYAVACRLPG